MAEVNQNSFHPICHNKVANSGSWHLLQIQGLTQEFLQFLKVTMKAPMFDQAQQNSAKILLPLQGFEVPRIPVSQYYCSQRIQTVHTLYMEVSG